MNNEKDVILFQDNPEVKAYIEWLLAELEKEDK